MKRLLTALLALLGLLGAPACFAIGPYLAGTAIPAGTYNVVATATDAATCATTARRP